MSHVHPAYSPHLTSPLRGEEFSALSPLFFKIVPVVKQCPSMNMVPAFGRVDAGGGLIRLREIVIIPARVRVNRGYAGNVSYPMTIAQTCLR